MTYAVAEAKLSEVREWIRATPAVCRDAMRAVPPLAIVKAREGQTLHVPAPGERGDVRGYRDGLVLVHLPNVKSIPGVAKLFGPLHLRRPVAIQSGWCEPGWLEVVEYASVEGIALTSEFVAKLLDD